MRVTHDELAELEGVKQSAALQKVLESKGIAYSVGKGGKLWTTTEELDRHIQLQSSQKRHRSF